MSGYQVLQLAMQFEADVDALLGDPGAPDADSVTRAHLLLRWRELVALGVELDPDTDRYFRGLDCAVAA